MCFHLKHLWNSLANFCLETSKLYVSWHQMSTSDLFSSLPLLDVCCIYLLFICFPHLVPELYRPFQKFYYYLKDGTYCFISQFLTQTTLLLSSPCNTELHTWSGNSVLSMLLHQHLPVRHWKESLQLVISCMDLLTLILMVQERLWDLISWYQYCFLHLLSVHY